MNSNELKIWLAIFGLIALALILDTIEGLVTCL
jgi:hypothetical protein